MYNTDMPTRAELPSSKKLIRSTLIALATAGVLLVTVVLPAEYAIDPTGLGKVLGLTQMGEIKQQLDAEAAEAAKGQVKIAAQALPAAVAQQEASTAQEAANTAAAAIPSPALPDAAQWTDTVTLTLAPGEAREVKLIMQKGGVAQYEWVTTQGHLNSDLHGDGANNAFISYRKGRTEASDGGELIAEFDGSHGWFWRNRSDKDVDVTLRVKGEYSEIKRVL